MLYRIRANRIFPAANSTRDAIRKIRTKVFTLSCQRIARITASPAAARIMGTQRSRSDSCPRNRSRSIQVKHITNKRETAASMIWKSVAFEISERYITGMAMEKTVRKIRDYQRVNREPVPEKSCRVRRTMATISIP